jgi:CHAT domain-containing protein
MIRFYQEVVSSSTPKLSSGLSIAQQWLQNLTVAEAEALLMSTGIDVPQDELFALLPKDGRPFEHPRFWAAFKLVVGS